MNIRSFLGFAIGIVIGGLAVFGMTRMSGEAPDVQSPGFPEPFIAEPESFTVSSCATSPMSNAPCFLVQAGGKRLVFGAPLHNDWRGIGQVDSVFLMDGYPVSSGGLLGLRYETWLDGRPERQALVSGELSLESVQAIDEALIVPDALSRMASGRRLDAREAGYTVRPVATDAQRMSVFNTGDLQVYARSFLDETGDQLISYRLIYDELIVDLYACGGQRQQIAGGAPDAVIIPVVDREMLAEQMRRATYRRYQAREMDIRASARFCPSLTEARDFAHLAEATELITIGITDPEIVPNFESVGVSWLPLDDEFVRIGD